MLTDSPGEDGQVNIWDLESADTTPLFTAHHSTFGAVFAATWAVAPEDSSEGIFVIGTTSGRIFVYAWNSTQVCINTNLADIHGILNVSALAQDCYKLSDYQDAHDSTIDDLAFDPVHRMLASSGNGEVHIRTLTTEGEPVFIIVTGNLAKSSPGVLQKPSRSIPRVLFKTIDQVLRVAAVSRVFFTDRGKTFVVLYRENHLGFAFAAPILFRRLLIKTVESRIRSTHGKRSGTRFCLPECMYSFPSRNYGDKNSKSYSGLGTLSSDNYIVVTNLNNGVDVYNVPPRVPIASVSHPMVQNFPVQVSSLDKGLVVVGSEDGFVTLWNWRTDEKKRFSHNGCMSTPFERIEVYIADVVCSFQPGPSCGCV